MDSEVAILNAIFKKLDGDIKTHKIELLKGYLDHWATDSVNKYDRGINLSNDKLDKILKTNQFQTKLRRMGYKLSLFGTGYGLVIYRYKKNSVIDVVKISAPKTRFGRLVDVYFNTDEQITIDNADTKEQVYLQGRFYIDKSGKVLKEVGYTSNSAWVVTKEAIEYDTKEIPLVPFDNNSLQTPDIKQTSRNLLKQAEEFVNKIPKEYEKGKVIFAFNNMINSANNGKDFKDKVIDKGDDTIDITDPDGVVANSIAPINAGMSTVELIEKIFGFYDNRARELSFQFRDHGTDTRKSEYDLMLFNQKAFEYMMTKISHRQDQLQTFIDMLAKIEGVSSPDVTLVISEFEQNRIDNLQAITDLKVAQAAQAKGIAAKNNSEAAAIDKGAAAPSAPGAVSSDINMPGVETKAK